MENETTPGLRLDAVVMICGAAVMIFEITGSRVVAPFIGTSTYIWTSLIGVILAALSLGYWFGGRMADRNPSRTVLAAAILGSSGLIGVTSLVKDLVLTMIAAFPVALELKALAAAIILFAPASVLLGFVTPYAVRLRMTSVGEAGRTVGRLYAVSTIGSIAGTFLAGFLLLPFLGTNRTLYLLIASLLAASLLLVPVGSGRRKAAVILVLLSSIVLNEATAWAMFRSAALEDIDTQYNRVRVFETTDSATRRPIDVMTFDPYSTQSAIYKGSDELVFEYTKFYHLINVLRPGHKRALMIGGAGYSFPKAHLAAYPEAGIDVVEIDAGLTEIARRRFRLQDDPRLRIFHEDGRTFLRRSDLGSYDVVLMDAFGSLFSIPAHLTTREAVNDISRILDDKGVVVFNVGSALRGHASLFLQAELATYRSIFPVVYVFKVRPERADTELQNLIIVACKQECLPANAAGDPLLSCRYTGDIPISVPPLTDDLAPVERYASIAHAASH